LNHAFGGLAGLHPNPLREHINSAPTDPTPSSLLGLKGKEGKGGEGKRREGGEMKGLGPSPNV